MEIFGHWVCTCWASVDIAKHYSKIDCINCCILSQFQLLYFLTQTLYSYDCFSFFIFYDRCDCFILYFPGSYEVEPLFMSLLPFRYLLVKCLFKTFDDFSLNWVICLFVPFIVLIYVFLWVFFFSDKSFANIVSHYVSLFFFLILSFDKQKSFILIKYNIIVFSFMISACCVLLKKFLFIPHNHENTFLMKLSSRSFIALPSTFRSVMYLELIFYEFYEGRDQRAFLPIWISTTIYWKDQFATTL